MYKVKQLIKPETYRELIWSIKNNIFELLGILCVVFLLTILIIVAIVECDRNKKIDAYLAKPDIHQMYEEETKKFFSKFNIQYNVLSCSEEIKKIESKQLQTRCMYSTNKSQLLSLTVTANITVEDSVQITSWEFDGL